MNLYKKRKKRPYLLLELMIAFSLLSICAVPLVRNPLCLLRRQLIAAEKSELARLAVCEFATIKGQLYQSEFAWEQLCKTKPQFKKKIPKERAPDFRDTAIITLAHELKFQKSVYFWSEHENKDAEGHEIRLINVRICYEPIKRKGDTYVFNWQVFIQKNDPKKT